METQDAHHPARGTRPGSSDPVARSGQTADLSAGREPSHLPPSPEAFQILERTANGRRVIAPCGELDLSTAALLKERLAGNNDTVLDLSNVSFIDSTGIHAIVSTAHRARSEAWEFTVRNPQPPVLRVIELVGLAEHLGLEDQTPPEEGAKQPSRLP